MKVKCRKCNTILDVKEYGIIEHCKCKAIGVEETDIGTTIYGDMPSVICIDEDGKESKLLNDEEPELIQVETDMIENNSKVVFIFLDIDGVLNDVTYIEKCYNHNGKHPMSMNYAPFNPKSLDNLMKLVRFIEKQEYDPKIVLSSTWRLNKIDTEIVNARLAEYGLRIYKSTPIMEHNRGQEIKEFLRIVEKYKTYLILDDEINDIVEFLPNMDNIIKTNPKYGFNEDKLNEAILKLDKLL